MPCLLHDANYAKTTGCRIKHGMPHGDVETGCITGLKQQIGTLLQEVAFVADIVLNVVCWMLLCAW
jgi:hypothetical protein